MLFNLPYHQKVPLGVTYLATQSYKHKEALCLARKCQTHHHAKSHARSQRVKCFYSTSLWSAGSQGPLLATGSQKVLPGRAGLSESHICTPSPHIDTARHTAMYSVTPRVTEAHMHRHTHSQSHQVPHWGLAVGAGSGRQLRKSPHSSPSRSPSPRPPCFLSQCQRPGRLGRGPGTARPRGGSRRRETRSRHSPRPSQGGGPLEHPHTHTQGPARPPREDSPLFWDST